MWHILRDGLRWISERGLGFAAIVACVAVLFGVEQVNHVVFQLPSISTAYQGSGQGFVFALCFWLFLLILLSTYVLLAIHVVPLDDQPAVTWCGSFFTTRTGFALLVIVWLLFVTAFAFFCRRAPDTLWEDWTWANAVGLPVFFLLAFFTAKAGNAAWSEWLSNLPMKLAGQSWQYWDVLWWVCLGLFIVFVAMVVVDARFWKPLAWQASTGLYCIAAGFCACGVGAYAHFQYHLATATAASAAAAPPAPPPPTPAEQAEATLHWMAPFYRALWFFLLMNALGEVLWKLPEGFPNVFSYRNYSIWCILHLLYSVVVVARILDWWQMKSGIPVRVVGIIALLLFATLSAGPANVGHTPPSDADEPKAEVWLRALLNRVTATSDTEPVIVVSASGGGSRAALFTALVYQSLVNEPTKKGSRADQIVLINAVSGGSLASAYYGIYCDEPKKLRLTQEWALRQSLSDQIKHWLPKKAAEFAEASEANQMHASKLKKDVDKLLWEHTRNICRGLRGDMGYSAFGGAYRWMLTSRFPDDMCTDFMAPLLRGVLYPSTERGVGVTDFWQTRFQGLKHKSSEPWPTTRPLLLLNATEIESGKRLVAGFPPVPAGFFKPEAGLQTDGNPSLQYAQELHHPFALADRDPHLRLTLGEAVRLSANFPFGFNPARIHLSKPKPRLRDPHTLTVIDGGVLDNTGFDTLAALFESIDQLARSSKKPIPKKKDEYADVHDPALLAKCLMNELNRRGILLIEIDSGLRPGQLGFVAQLFTNVSGPLEALGTAGFVSFLNAKRSNIESIREPFITEELKDSKGAAHRFPVCRYVQYYCNHSENVITAWALGPKDKAAILVQFIFDQELKKSFVPELYADLRQLQGIRELPEGQRGRQVDLYLRDHKAREQFRQAVELMASLNKAAISGESIPASAGGQLDRARPAVKTAPGVVVPPPAAEPFKLLHSNLKQKF
ncbi:MAG: patatin-like phospholipase family protein [Planctomycetes bacterium]|nr:patatin-like phospholipase family protein [Planctomycetota bacterium]